MTLATIYAPNNNQDQFICATINKLMKFTDGKLILGGDFNLPLDPKMDTSGGSSSVATGLRKRVLQMLHNYQLTDAWRAYHPDERDYTFYSVPHKAYSRIDLFFTPQSMLTAVKEVAIGSITWSDHSPVSLTLTMNEYSSDKRRQWRLNESLMEDKMVVEDVIKELQYYFQYNTVEETDAGII